MRKAQTMTRFAVLFVLALASVAVCTSAQQQGAPEVACKGPSGQNVDWWLMYQYNLLNPISYADSTNPGVFDIPANEAAVNTSPLFRTVEQLFQGPEKPSYIARSRRTVSLFYPIEKDGDEAGFNTANGFPLDTTSSNPDFLLGALNRKSGDVFVENSFGIFHNDPLFPPLRDDSGLRRPSATPGWKVVAQPTESQSLYYFCISFQNMSQVNEVMKVFGKRMTYLISNSSRAEGTGSNDLFQSLFSLPSFGDASDECASSLNKTIGEAQENCVGRYEMRQGETSKQTILSVSREFPLEACLKETTVVGEDETKLDVIVSWEKPFDTSYEAASLPYAGLFAVTGSASFRHRTVCIGSPLADQQSGFQKSLYGSVLICMKHQELWRRFFTLGLTFATSCDMGPLENVLKSNIISSFVTLGRTDLKTLQENVEEMAEEIEEVMEENEEGPLTTLPGSTLRSTLTLPQRQSDSGGGSGGGDEDPKSLKVVMFQGGKADQSGTLFAIIADKKAMFVDFGSAEMYFQQAMKQLIDEFQIQEKDINAIVSTNYDNGYINGAFEDSKTKINDVLKAVIAAKPSDNERPFAINNFYDSAIPIVAEMLSSAATTYATTKVGDITDDEAFEVFSQSVVALKLIDDDPKISCWSTAGAKNFSATDPDAWPKYGQRPPRLASEVSAPNKKRSLNPSSSSSSSSSLEDKKTFGITSKNGHIRLNSINSAKSDDAQSFSLVAPSSTRSWLKKPAHNTFHDNLDAIPVPGGSFANKKEERVSNKFGSRLDLLHRLVQVRQEVGSGSGSGSREYQRGKRDIQDYDQLIPGLTQDADTGMKAVTWLVGEDDVMKDIFDSVKVEAANPSKVEYYCIAMKDLVLSAKGGVFRKYEKSILAETPEAKYDQFADRTKTLENAQKFASETPLNGANYTKLLPTGVWEPESVTGDTNKMEIEDPQTGEEALANTLDWNSIAFFVSSAEDGGPTLGLFSSSSMPQSLVQDRTTVATINVAEDVPLTSIGFMVVPKFGSQSHNPEILFQKILSRYYFITGSNADAFQPSFQTLKSIVDARRPPPTGGNPCSNNDVGPAADFFIVLSNDALYDEDGCNVLPQLMTECSIRTMNVWSNLPNKMEVCRYSPACRKYSLGFATSEAETPQDVEGVYFALDLSFTSKEIKTEGSFGGEKGSAVDCNGAVVGKKGKIIRPCIGVNQYEEKANGPTTTVSSSCASSGKTKNEKAAKDLQKQQEELKKLPQSKQNDEKLKAIEKKIQQIEDNRKKIEKKIADAKTKEQQDIDDYENDVKNRKEKVEKQVKDLENEQQTLTQNTKRTPAEEKRLKALDNEIKKLKSKAEKTVSKYKVLEDARLEQKEELKNAAKERLESINKIVEAQKAAAAKAAKSSSPSSNPQSSSPSTTTTTTTTTTSTTTPSTQQQTPGTQQPSIGTPPSSSATTPTNPSTSTTPSSSSSSSSSSNSQPSAQSQIPGGASTINTNPSSPVTPPGGPNAQSTFVKSIVSAFFASRSGNGGAASSSTTQQSTP